MTHFLVINQFIRIRIKVRPGWTNVETGKVGAPRMQYINFEMLQNTVENNAKRLTIQLDIHQLESDKVQDLQNRLKSYKGDKSLFFSVYDAEKKVKLTLNSKKQKIKITSELLSELEADQWFYNLN